jgi:hypothetical protein
MNKLSDFTKGIITGFLCTAIIFGLIVGLIIKRNKDKEKIKYAEKQIEIEALREDYSNRDPAEFLDDIPGVRRAADGAAAEFERKRDEILERFRSRPID